MSEHYEPQFTMTGEITGLIVEIGELVGSISTYEAMNPNPVLRRESRIRTIHSSLAIEQNALTLEQVTDVINGKRVLGRAGDQGESTEFVVFMLGMIRDALQEISKVQDEHNVVINVAKNVVTNEDKVISLLRQDNSLSANMLANSLGITQRQAQRILSKLKGEGKLLRHGANKNGYWEVINN